MTFMDKKKAKQLVSEGLDLQNEGDMFEAEKRYLAATKICPNFGEGHLRYGDLLAQTERPNGAVKEFNLAIDSQPDFAEAMTALGDLYAKYHEKEKAIAAYEKAINCKKLYIFAYINLGTHLMNNGQFGEAQDTFEKAIKKTDDPDIIKEIKKYYSGI